MGDLGRLKAFGKGCTRFIPGGRPAVGHSTAERILCEVLVFMLLFVQLTGQVRLARRIWGQLEYQQTPAGEDYRVFEGGYGLISLGSVEGMDSGRGKNRLKVVPLPGRLSAVIAPPALRIVACAMARSSP